MQVSHVAGGADPKEVLSQNLPVSGNLFDALEMALR